MAIRTAQAITVNGVAPVYHAATPNTGDQVLAGERIWIHVRNGGGSSSTVTISGAGATSYGEPMPDKQYTVPAGEELLIPLLPEFGNPEDGRLATFVCNPAADVTFAALRI